ncbi:MAG: SLC13 family permease [Bacillota bacterium]
MIGKKNYAIILLIISLVILITINVEAANINEDSLLKSETAFNINIAVVALIIISILILFYLEPIPIGLISITIPFLLVSLNKWTKMSTEDALSGFSNGATITVMAMFVLSKGIQNSGALKILQNKIENITGSNLRKQVLTISSLTSGMASFINNTPTVAAFVPMVSNLARKTNNSPSKLLIPLSYAAMFGGTVTLLGTSTNILASQVSARILDHPFSMFEFTKLGIIVVIVGILYLVTVGYKILPDKLTYEDDLFTEYELKKFLTEVEVKKESDFVGENIGDISEQLCEEDIDIVQVIRDREKFMEPLEVKTVRAGDHLIIRTDEETLLKLFKNREIRILPEIDITQKQLENPEKGEEIVELVIPDNSFMENQTIKESNFLERYNASLLAIREGRELTHEKLDEVKLTAGNVLLLLVTESTLERLRKNSNFIIEEKNLETSNINYKEMFGAISIVVSVILLAALNILPISIATLGGVAAMVGSGLVEAQEVYKSINWEVFFLLSGLIPLGLAVEKTGTASFIAEALVNIAGILPPLIILMILYLINSLLAGVIGNSSSVVLMIPIAVGVAQQIGANPFAFLLTVTFASSSAFATPMGYQTNLMVYGPGGYRFSDFVKVGLPLQLIMAIVVPFFITIFWGL